MLMSALSWANKAASSKFAFRTDLCTAPPIPIINLFFFFVRVELGNTLLRLIDKSKINLKLHR